MARGLRLTIIGLVAGLLLGLSINLLKAYIGQQLIALLRNEASGACNCEINYDSFSISLLRLEAQARNIRLLEAGKEMLRVEKLSASFGTSQIRNKQIILNLVLTRASSIGVAPASATYRFIDFLATPQHPERRNEDRWRLKLHSLQLKDSTAIQDIAGARLFMEGVAMPVIRDEQDNFNITPSVKKLTLRYGDGDAATVFDVGEMKASIYLDDFSTQLRQLALSQASSWLNMAFTIARGAQKKVAGNAQFQLNAESLKLTPELQGAFAGTSTIKGIISEPDLEGEVHLAPSSSLKITKPFDAPIQINSLNSKFTARISDEGNSMLHIASATANGDAASLAIEKAISLRPEELNGAIRFSLEHAAFKGIVLEQVHGVVALARNAGAIRPDIAMTVGTLRSAGGIELHGLSASVRPAADSSATIRISQSSDQGSVALEGGVTLSPVVAARDIKIVVNGISVGTKGAPGGLLLSGSGTVNGPMTAEALKGSLAWRLDRDGKGIAEGSMTLDRGRIALQSNAANADLNISGSLDINEKGRSQVLVKASKFNAASLFPNVDCVQVSGTLDYQFPGLSLKSGSGVLDTQELDLGCESYKVSLSKPARAIITEGSMQLPSMLLVGQDTSLTIGGSLSYTKGYDLVSKGTIQLLSLSSVLPSVDDLQGILKTELALRGPIHQPVLSGSARFEDALIAIDAADVSIANLGGTMLFKNNVLTFQDFGGTLNDGAFKLSGSIDPFSVELSDVRLSAENVLFSPDERSSLILSGDLDIRRGDNGRATLHGIVTVNSAEFQREINLQTLLRSLTRVLFSTPARAARVGNTQLPEIDLDLNVQAPENLFVIMNWLNAELRAQFNIRGTATAPLISGELQTLSGWFELRDRRFDISAGTARFYPGNPDPTLEIFGEASIRSLIGELVTVYLQTSGNLSSPRVTLSSDRGLSQRDLLNLLTTGGHFDEETLVNRGRRRLASNIDERDDDQFILGGFFRDLARIDSISIEPTLDPRTGIVGPSIVAKKRLMDRLSLLGETSFGSSATEARATAIFNLFPSVNLLAGAESLSTRKRTALGVDLRFTVLAEQSPFLQTSIAGTNQISRYSLLQSLRVSEDSRIPPADMARLAARIVEYYKSEGYFEAQADAKCISADHWCRNMAITVIEGERSTVERIVFEGEALPDTVRPDESSQARENAPATLALQRKIERSVIAAARREGYLSARVDGSYEAGDRERQKILRLKVRMGVPVSFNFVGNTAFSAEEFLETINLFGRRQPFGNNTISILVQNMDRLYREAGYLYASIQSTRSIDEATGRINYLITVTEERRIAVAKVDFENMHALSAAELRRKIRATFGDEARAILSPDTAVEEMIQAGDVMIAEVFRAEGFPDVTVSHRIEQLESEGEVRIIYEVNEGGGFHTSTLSVQGLSGQIELPSSPEAPISVPKTNRYIQEILGKLNDAGYFSPSLTTAPSEDGMEIVVSVDSGPQTAIGEISIEGNVEISEDTIRQRLQLQSGEPWNLNTLDEAKRRLLRSGLFSSVSIEPVDNALDATREDMAVRLTEKPLTTLEVGVGANSEYGAHVFTQGLDRALFKDGQTLSLRLDAYYDSVEGQISQGIAAAGYANADVLGSGVVFNEDLRYQKMDLPTQEFDLDRLSLNTFLYKTLAERYTVSFGHTLASENLDNVSSDAILSSLDSGSVRLSYLTAALQVDHRDDPVLPESGVNFKADAKYSSEALWSEANYLSIESKISFLTPIDAITDRLSLAWSLSGGISWTYAGTDELPITQRFYLGGRTTVRGFRENSLGPRGEDDAVLGGDRFVAQNLELRYRMHDAFSLHAFFDAGNVFLTSSGESYDLRESAGVGFRYLSPVGPIGFDIGHPLDEQVGEPSVRFHFDIGSNF